jgi:O-antigen/teichoic acid export membrane protein
VKALSGYVSRTAEPDRSRPRQPFAVIAYKATADSVSKAVTLVVTIVAARTLPPAEFGVLALAMTTGWLLSVASDAGLPLDLARQIAQASSDGGRPPFAPVRDAMRLRVALGAGATVVGVAVGILLAPDGLVPAFVVIVLAQVLNATLETLSHAFRGVGRSDVEASVSLVQRAASGLAACAVMAVAPSLLWVGVALAVPPALALAASMVIVRRMTEGAATGGAAIATASTLSGRFLREVAPIGGAILLSALYFRCDVYFVARWHGLETVGVYNAAFRIVEALRLVPAAVLAVTFPLLCRTTSWRPLTNVMGFLLPASVVVAALLYATAPQLLLILYGPACVAAAPALRMLALAVPFFFINYALTHQVIAWDGQRAYLGVTALALVTNLAANALLIPDGGMRGAAAATLLTEISVFAGCGWALVLGRVGQVGRADAAGGRYGASRRSSPAKVASDGGQIEWDGQVGADSLSGDRR